MAHQGRTSHPIACTANAACLLWLALAILPGGVLCGPNVLAQEKKPSKRIIGGLRAGGPDNGEFALMAGQGDTACDLCFRGDVSCGQTVIGALSPGDCDMGDETYVDAYRLSLPESKRVRLNLRSTLFDTYLLVANGSCTKIIDENDDCDLFNTDSCLFLDLVAGTYFILANSFDPGETGNYSLEIACFPPLCVGCVRGNIDCGEMVRGTLAANDCDRGDGSYVDVYRFETPEPAFVTIELRSASFDTYLSISASDCREIFWNDDCDDLNLDPCLTAFLAPGTYFILANAFFPDETGPYELEIVDCACPAPEAPHDPFPADLAHGVPATTALSWDGTPAPAAGSVRRLKNIYGADDRRDEYEVTDQGLLSAGDSTVALVSRSALTENKDGTYSLPARTLAQDHLDDTGRPLCADEPFRDQPVAARCSGVLVGPQLVCTAGHCIPGSAECADVAFVFGFVMTDAKTPVLSVPASDVYFCAGILARQQADADWGLIRLDRPVTGHRPLSVRRVGGIALGQAVAVIGHPLALPRKYAGGANVKEASSPDFFQANLDCFGGSSGSPVLDPRTLELEGIAVRGFGDFVDDGPCDRSYRCPDEGCPGWGDVTRATAFGSLLPTFDVYLGTSAGAMERVASNRGTFWFEPGPLKGGATYHWKVVVKGPCATVEGPIWSFTTARGPGEESFRRGDANQDAAFDIGDAVFTLGYLFVQGPAPDCLDAAEANDDGKIDIADAIATLTCLFSGPAPLPAPFEACGVDPTMDEVACEYYPHCRP